ncbi:MAG: segregation/condensation protein A [Candidatus Dormibacteraeota bacterium]|nr:segregation/condensation protein A [Candidatus Dormibacteraeota bacterium]
MHDEARAVEVAPQLRVKSPLFEGPLELLLALVERSEIDIFQLQLADLTDAYLAQVAELETKDVDEMAEFLWLASRLLLLKSIRLLPGEEPEPEETELLDWEEEVRLRLLEYRAYKEMAHELSRRAERDETSFPPPVREIETEGQEVPLRVDALVVAFQSALARVPPRPLVFTGHTWTLEDKLKALRSRLAQGGFDLTELILESLDRLEAVVTFVAILELLRRGEIRVRQREKFERIWVEPA